MPANLVDDDACPNSFVRHEERVQGEEEGEAAYQRKGGQTGTPTGPTRSWVSDARNRRKLGFFCSFSHFEHII